VLHFPHRVEIFCGARCDFGALFIARQDERTAQQSAQKSTQLDKRAFPAETDKQHSHENVPDTNRDTPSWYGFFRWPNGSTTWAVILTLMAIAEQTRETARAAKATEASVEEVKRQVTASHDGLRAWIAGNVTEIDPIENPLGEIYPEQRRFRWQIKNYGQTPAFIQFAAVEYSITDSPDVLDIQKAPPRAINRFLGAGMKEKNILTIRTEELNNCDLRKRFWTVVIKVKYEDAFGRPHESSASFAYYSPKGKGDPVARGFYQGTDKSTNYNT
jgi:hypothetical protein